MKVVAVIGAFAILLAATGLVVDLTRGDPQAAILEADTHTFLVTGTSVSEMTGATAGQCIPACVTSTHVQLRLQAPDLGALGARYVLVVDQDRFPFEAGRVDVALEGDRQGDRVHIEIDPGRIVMQFRLQDRISHEELLPPFVAGGSMQAEQIGLVEVSALFAGTLETDAPGTPVAWVDDTRLGALERHGDGWVFDFRVERLVLDDARELYITLESDPDATTPGLRLATATL